MVSRRCWRHAGTAEKKIAGGVEDENRKTGNPQFWKMQNRTLEFSDGIQLISGENESGKSTVHTFIRSMLFGMTRGRGRAAKMMSTVVMSHGKIRHTMRERWCLKAAANGSA